MSLLVSQKTTARGARGGARVGLVLASTMRRRPGIAGIHQRRDTSAVLRTVGEEASERSLETMRRQLTTFRQSLEEFALRHKADIRRDPAFRAQFHKMCANCGVDPLASNKGFWAELLGFGDFYYELGVQIAEACLSSRDENGGLLELHDLMAMVLKRRGKVAAPVSEDDVFRAIDRLKVLGGGWSVHSIGRGRIIRSVPDELNPDTSEVIRLAAAADGVGGGAPGCVSTTGLEKECGWTRGRVDAALGELVKRGMALVDDGDPSGSERLYWIPCVSPQMTS